MASAVLGALSVRSAVRHFGSQIVMPRSLMPALSVLMAGGAKLRPMLFDADGLAADERVEFAGLSSQGLTYRLLRDVEAQAVRQANSVIVRSRQAATILHARAGPPNAESQFHVVTNGRDDKLFTDGSVAGRSTVRHELGIDADAPVIVYAGSIGPQYRFDKLVDFVLAATALAPSARLLILSGSPDGARAALAEHSAQIAANAIVLAVSPDAVPRYLAACDLGIAYREPTFANRGVAPIKLSEYLLCGLPVLGTAAVGDTGDAVDAGVFLDEKSGAGEAAVWFTQSVMPQRDDMRVRARQVGVAGFSLASSIGDYRAALAPFLEAAG
jgi:glycosyltransferase involved in cell wall biosynthesis